MLDSFPTSIGIDSFWKKNRKFDFLTKTLYRLNFDRIIFEHSDADIYRWHSYYWMYVILEIPAAVKTTYLYSPPKVRFTHGIK